MAAPVAFGRYLLLDKLATGGMAEIFLARPAGDGGLEKTCVIKRVLPHLTTSTEFISLFLDEARLAARLSHPGIGQIFDLGKQGTDYFLAMEYLAGEDLSAVMKQSNRVGRPVPFEVAAKIIALAAEALDYAHALKGDDGRPLGLVHRDVSPSNLFVTYGGAVKVLDFGIASAGESRSAFPKERVRGKLPYVSPEQLERRSVDRRADLWALGVCLHELLTGERLFLRESGTATSKAVLEDPIPSLKKRRPDVPAELEEVTARCLSRSVEGRYQSAAELRAGLERCLEGVPPLGQFLEELFGHERAQQRLALMHGTPELPPRPETAPLSSATVRKASAPWERTTELASGLHGVKQRPADAKRRALLAGGAIGVAGFLSLLVWWLASHRG